MKRCPTCNRTFEEEWLSFCTQDGTTLIDSAPLSPETAPAIKASTSGETSSPDEQATWNLPSGSGSAGKTFEPQPVKPVWQPPPPPAYTQPPNKGLSVAAMILGIISVTVGWMCFGPIPAIAAIILGGVSLSQIKKDPERVTGKQFAWVGVITGSVSLLIYAGVMVAYLIAALMSASQR